MGDEFALDKLHVAFDLPLAYLGHAVNLGTRALTSPLRKSIQPCRQINIRGLRAKIKAWGLLILILLTPRQGCVK